MLRTIKRARRAHSRDTICACAKTVQTERHQRHVAWRIALAILGVDCLAVSRIVVLESDRPLETTINRFASSSVVGCRARAAHFNIADVAQRLELLLDG